MNRDKRRRSDRELCPRCGKSFRDSFNLQRHMNNIHDSDVSCMLCEYKSAEKEMNLHYKVVHGIVMDVQHSLFDSERDFDDWKNGVERKTCSRYIRGSTRRNKDGSLIVYYKCHRDGYYKSKGNNMRNLKHIGTNKINGRCPSYIRSCLIGGKVNVKFIATHIGHTNDVDRLSLTKNEREAIANEIISSVPADDVLRKIRKTINSKNIKRIHLTTKKDINNIVASYRLDHSDISELQESMFGSEDDKYFDEGSNTGKILEESKIDDFIDTCQISKYNEKCSIFNEVNNTDDGVINCSNDENINRPLCVSSSGFLKDSSNDSEMSANNCACDKTDGSGGFQIEDGHCEELVPNHSSSSLLNGCVEFEVLSDSNETGQRVGVEDDISSFPVMLESEGLFHTESSVLERKKEKFLDKICKMLDLVESREDMESVLRHAVPLDSVISSLKNRSLTRVSKYDRVEVVTESSKEAVLDHSISMEDLESPDDRIAYEVVIE